MSDLRESNWAEKIGAPCFSNLREMVAALECDYERLETLRDERDSFEMGEDRNAAQDAPGYANNLLAWMGENVDDAKELMELEEACCPCGNECKSREDAEQMIHEDPLSVEVRSDWTSPGDEMTPEEFQILLSTGGPATRIIGELDEHGEPCRAWLEVQDWGKPWTEYFAGSEAVEVLLTYARCFIYRV